jgi:small subunit ribosomal protein S7
MKFFGRWSGEGIAIKDAGLARYINLKPILVPHLYGRYRRRFWKSRLSIVERLANKVLISGHRGKKHWRTSGRRVGKKAKALKIVRKAFELIEQKTKQNPIEILVRAIENSAPREEITVIEYGGIRHPKAVDVAPQRRVDLALRWLTQGAFGASIASKLSVEQALANELMLASRNDNKSFAIAKKIEVERQAAASR